MKTPNPIQNANNIRRTTKFVVDLGIEIGIDVKAGNKTAQCIFIEGFGSTHFHIYPVIPENLRGAKPVIIDANDVIITAKKRLKDQKSMHY